MLDISRPSNVIVKAFSESMTGKMQGCKLCDLVGTTFGVCMHPNNITLWGHIWVEFHSLSNNALIYLIGTRHHVSGDIK